MNKFGWIICIFVFVSVTIFIVAADSNTGTRKVQFSNQSFQINNKGNEISNNSNTKITLANSNINNKEINTQNSNVSLNSNSVNIDSTDISNKDIDYSNPKISYNNDYDYNNQANNSEALDYKNLDDTHLDNALKEARNYSYKPANSDDKPFRQMPNNRYAYKNIDWNTWKSNFVNKILDDSLAIRELDNYNYGTLIYYSFTVDKSGGISNIQVKSMTVKPEDKEKLARMIKSYQYQEITAFPAKSQRKSANVSAVMMLSNESQYSKPSNFNDVEHVKYKL